MTSHFHQSPKWNEAIEKAKKQGIDPDMIFAVVPSGSFFAQIPSVYMPKGYLPMMQWVDNFSIFYVGKNPFISASD